MITVQNSSGPVFVGTGAGELALTNAGTWTFHQVSYISWGFGGCSNLAGLRDGSVITVDGGGRWEITNGPDLVGSSVWGFGLAISTIGIILGIKWALRRMLSAGSIAGGSID